jgi:hypothetical protein
VLETIRDNGGQSMTGNGSHKPAEHSWAENIQ